MRHAATVCCSKYHIGQWNPVLDPQPWLGLDFSCTPPRLHSNIEGCDSSKVILICNQYTCKHGSLSYFSQIETCFPQEWSHWNSVSTTEATGRKLDLGNGRHLYVAWLMSVTQASANKSFTSVREGATKFDSSVLLDSISVQAYGNFLN